MRTDAIFSSRRYDAAFGDEPPLLPKTSQGSAVHAARR